MTRQTIFTEAATLVKSAEDNTRRMYETYVLEAIQIASPQMGVQVKPPQSNMTINAPTLSLADDDDEFISKNHGQRGGQERDEVDRYLFNVPEEFLV